MIKEKIDLVSNFADKNKSNIWSNVLLEDGKMTASNGLTSITLDVDLGINFCCNAEMLKKALKNCDSDKLKIEIKDSELIVKSGRFRSKIKTIDIESYPSVDDVDVDYQAIDNSFIDDLKILSSFCNKNDVRVQFHGVAIEGNQIKSTNGYILAKKDTDIDINAIIPQAAIDLLYSSKQDFNGIGMKSGNAYFKLQDGFVFTRCIDVKYPDISKLIMEVENDTNLAEIKEDIKSISQFCDDSKTIVLGDSIATRDGATKIEGFNLAQSAFNADYLLKIIDFAESIDLSKYPGVCPFEGGGIKGAIAGVRL